jgi:hypothetical protein
MGRLPQLVEALELVDGREPGSLYGFARACRDEGVIPPSPVGRGAATLSYREAADIFLATVIPVPKRQLQAAVAVFRALPRRGASREFRISRTKRYLSLPDTAGEFLELLIKSAPSLPEGLAILFRFSPLGLHLVVGIGQALAAEYTARRDIGLLGGGGDRTIEQRVSFTRETLLRVHHALQ